MISKFRNFEIRFSPHSIMGPINFTDLYLNQHGSENYYESHQMVSNPKPMRTFIAMVVIIAVIIFTILAIIWVTILKRQTAIPLPPGFTKSGLGMRCTDLSSIVSGNPEAYTPQQCDTGLVCVKHQSTDTF